MDLYGLWFFGVEAYSGIGGGINVAYFVGTLEVTGRLGVGIGGWLLLIQMVLLLHILKAVALVILRKHLLLHLLRRLWASK